MTWDTVNVLTIPQAREIAGKLAGKILDVLGMYQVGTCLVLCPFPCDVLAMYQPGTLALAPSEYGATNQEGVGIDRQTSSSAGEGRVLCVCGWSEREDVAKGRLTAR